MTLVTGYGVTALLPSTVLLPEIVMSWRTSMRRGLCTVALLILILGWGFAVPASAHHLKQGATTTLPVTTSSAAARRLYAKGVTDFENLYLERCNEDQYMPYHMWHRLKL